MASIRKCRLKDKAMVELLARRAGPDKALAEFPELMLETIAGHDPLDPGSAAAPAGHYASRLERGVRGTRIGFVRHFHESDVPADREVTAALEHVARTLETLGGELRDVRLPTLGEFCPTEKRDFGIDGQIEIVATGVNQKPNGSREDLSTSSSFRKPGSTASQRKWN
jgi:hypothetical protein